MPQATVHLKPGVFRSGRTLIGEPREQLLLAGDITLSDLETKRFLLVTSKLPNGTVLRDYISVEQISSVHLVEKP